MNQFLSVNEVSKAYPGESLGAVNGVSFSMEKGEIFSLVGESGSGKSTLLRMVAGLLKPDTGNIVFRQEPLADPEEQLIAGHQAIKMVFQDFDLMPNMTVAENLRYPLLSYNKEYSAARVEELLELCRISDLAHKLPRELSGGQQQRVALARALADEPTLLLMDEPFSQLDPINKRDLLQEVLRILKLEDVSLILVTHDTKDALMVSDRIGFLKQGSLMQVGTPNVLYHEPQNREVASFFGTVNYFSLEETKQYLPQALPLMKERGVGHIGIRAEYVEVTSSIDESQLQVQIESEFFLGTGFLVQAILPGGKSVTFMSSDSLLNKEPCNLSFRLDRLLFFLD